MAELPSIDPTLQAADAALEARARRGKHRPYLGMSAIGHPCSRRLWYGFRWARAPQFDAATLKRFEDGHRGEDLQAERLRLVEHLDLLTIDPATGRQFAFVDHGGHFRGHADGLISGLLQAPKTRHVWEHKQVGEKKQAALQKAKREHGEKEALAAWDEIYYAQAVLYMACAGLDRHYLTCSTPGGRHTVSARTDADPEAAARLRDKARRIIEAVEPPARLSDQPEFYLCRWCEFSEICHGTELPEPTCRACCHATPELDGDGRWSCALWRDDIPESAQRAGCEHHAYIPALISYATLETADKDANRITYATPDGRLFTNGSQPDMLSPLRLPHHSSRELHETPPDSIGATS